MNAGRLVSHEDPKRRLLSPFRVRQMMCVRRLPAAVLAAVVAVAPPATAQLAKPRVDTLTHGIVRVRNSAPTQWRDTSGWRLVLERTIGSKGAGKGSLAQPTAIAVDRDGHVIVADLNGDGLLVFNVDGSFARVLGAKGGGPGEYRGPIALGVRGDTVAICDAGQDRVIIWRTAGTKLTEWRSPWCSIGRIVMDGRGGVLIPSLLREGRTAHEIWIRRRLDGAGSDTLRPPPDPVPPKEMVPNRRGASPGVIVLPMPVPFQPRTSATFTTSGTYVYGYSASYTLLMSASFADTTRIIEMPGARMSIDRAVADSWFTKLNRGASANGGFKRSDFPTAHGFFIGLHTDEANRIWVERPATDGTVGFFDVIDVSGAFLGTVRSPGGGFYQAVRGNGRVYRPAERSDGEPVIEVYRIERTPR